MKEILLYGAIGWDSDPRDIVRQFQEAAGEDVLLRIHSEGGSVLDGEAILSAIRQHDGAVHGQVDGMAFSMAAVIALELRENLSMPEDGWLMFHEVRNHSGGQVADLERQVDMMRRMNASTAAKLSAALGVPAEDAAEMLKNEIWMSGAEAHAAGLVTTLLPAHALAAHVREGEWKNPPRALFENKKPTKQDEMKFFKMFAKNDDGGSSLEVAEVGPEDIGSEAVTALQKDLDEVKATHAAELVARDEKHKAEVENRVAEVTKEFEAKLEEQKESLNAAHAKEISVMKEAIEAAENSSEEKAKLIVAQAGHPPVKTSDPEDQSIVERYQDMKPGPERSKFRQEHKAELEKHFGRGALSVTRR